MDRIQTIKYLIFLTLFSIFFTACSNKNIQIKDLEKYSQNPDSYINDNIFFKNQDIYNEKFFKNYFTVWDEPIIDISKKEATWGFYYTKKDIYLQNFSKATKEWFDNQIENSNFDNFKKELKKAITIKNSDVRVFPTKEMMFYNPYKAGEGFPFDYNQNSSIKINTPILISHYSKDKAWAYIRTNSFYGWISMDDIAFVDEKFIKKFKTNNYALTTKDKMNIYDDFYIEKLQLATLIPYKNNNFYIAKKDKKHNAYLTKIKIDKGNISLKPLVFNKKNISKISKQLIGEQYSWGGALGFRDCSSFTQDFFASFGIYINRNSKGQTKNGKYITLENLTKKEKINYIVQKGKPFKTLIYLKGHIMLYIGVNNNEPLVMHNVWGVRTKNILNEEGRNIIGKNIISTLNYGNELINYDRQNTIVDKIKGIVILDENN